MTAPGRKLATRPWEFCRALVEDIGARPAGSASEHKASHYAADVLRAMGYSVDLDTFRVPRDAWTVPGALLAAEAVVAVAGLLRPLPAAALALLLAATLWTEALGFPTVSLLWRPVKTRNVWAHLPARGAVARTLVLLAHVDSPRTFPDAFPRSPRAQRGLARTAAYAALLVPLVLAAAALPGLAVVRFAAVPLAAVLSVAGTMLLLARDGRPVSGANDAASGVAAVLAAAGEHAVRPLEQTNLEILVTGASEVGPWGLRRFSRRFGKHYLRERTYLLDVSCVARGDFAALEREGLLVSTRGDPDLLQAVRTGARHEGYRHVKAELPTPGDGHFARLRGWRAATLVALERGRIPDHHSEADALPRVDPLQVEAAARLVIATTRELDRLDMPAVARRRTMR